MPFSLRSFRSRLLHRRPKQPNQDQPLRPQKHSERENIAPKLSFEQQIIDVSSAPELSYQPLKDPSGDIRVLRILPSSSPDDVVCVQVEHVRRDKFPQYDCLSYAWGDASKKKPILVNNCRLDVTENLLDGLLQLRHLKAEGFQRSELIWIDAICINQKDDDERSSQVQMMHSIFSQAAQVIIWLGLATAESTLGLQTIKHVVDQFPDHERLREKVVNEVETPKWLVECAKDLLERNTGSSVGPLLSAVEHIYGRPWWSRVWIIQEVAVAQKSWALCGSHVLDFGYFQKFYYCSERLMAVPGSEVGPLWPAIGSYFYRPPCMVHPVLNAKSINYQKTLYTLYSIYADREALATDPRDRLYALFGLQINAEAMGITVDYSIQWEALYEQFTRYLLKADGLAFLSFCMPTNARLQNTLPSWVPDLTQYIETSLGGYSPLGDAYSASKQTSQKLGVHGGEPGELFLSGVRVASINSVEEQWPFPFSLSDDRTYREWIDAEKQWIQSLRSLALQLEAPEDMQDDLVRRVATADISIDYEWFRRSHTGDQARYNAFIEFINLPSGEDSGYSHDKEQELEGMAYSYRRCVSHAAQGRRPFLSDRGHIGLVPESAEVGDILCIFHGATTPFALKPEPDGRYRLLGEAYAFGIMDGEFMDTAPATETFILR